MRKLQTTRPHQNFQASIRYFQWGCCAVCSVVIGGLFADFGLRHAPAQGRPASRNVQNAVVAPPETMPRVIPTRQRCFSIPFQIYKPGAGVFRPKEVQLLVSRDRGTHWYPYETAPPDQGYFVFKAVGDGEYWFLLRTVDQSGRVRAAETTRPGLRVLVDTTPPLLEFHTSQTASGQIAADWKIEETNADPNGFVILYRSSPEEAWRHAPVDRRALASGETAVGSTSWQPSADASTIEVRAEVVDLAGNRNVSHARLALAPGGADNATGLAHAARAGRDAAAAPYAAREAATPAGGYATSYGGASSTGRDVSPSSGSEASPPSPDYFPPSATSTTSATPDDGSGYRPPSISGRGYSPPGMSSQSTESTPPPAPPSGPRGDSTVDDPDAVGYEDPSDPSLATENGASDDYAYGGYDAYEDEFEDDPYGAGNDGSSAEDYPAEGATVGATYGMASETGPIGADADAVDDGTSEAGYRPPSVATDPGGAASAYGGADVAAPAPASTSGRTGDETARPMAAVQLRSATMVEEVGEPHLVIQWQPGGPELAQGRVSLQYAESTEGPWNTIVGGIRNSGRFRWPVAPGLGDEVFLRLEILDPTGNLLSDQLPTPVSLVP